ncbi:MAG: hypothetical protein RX316_10015 [bacterium]|nr:hypothetical protein [bacterium]
MDGLTQELHLLAKDDLEVAEILDVFGEIDRVYGGSLVAMGIIDEHKAEVRNSAEVTISVRSAHSSSDY